MIYVDDQVGANDDEKVAAAFTKARNANGFTDTVVFSNRAYNLNASVPLKSGDSLSGEPGSGDEPRSSGNKNRIQCNAAVQFTFSEAMPHSITIQGLQFQGSNNIFMNPGTARLQTSVIRDVGFSKFKHVLGTPTSPFLISAVTFSGYWNVNNSYDRAFTISGWDSNLWTEGCLLDSPPTFIGGTGTKTHLELRGMSKNNVGPLYITAERESGLLIGGSATKGTYQGHLITDAARIEGRNKDQPSYGAVVRILGHGGVFRDLWVAYGMSNPALTGRNDAGMIHVEAGDWDFNGVSYFRATGVPESAPLLYVGSGARVRISRVNAMGAWNGKPVVAGPGTVIHDDSVTRV